MVVPNLEIECSPYEERYESFHVKSELHATTALLQEVHVLFL